MTNFNFAIGVYPKRFGYFFGNIEDFLDVTVRISAGRINEVDETKVLGMHRCNSNDIEKFNRPLNSY